MSTTATKPQVKRPVTPRYVRFARFAVRRGSDLAIASIILGAGVAVFAGSLSSAMAFGFPQWAAIAFAIMPDALMVYSATKQRQRGISPTQYSVAKRWMRVALGFSVFTNMNAAAMAIHVLRWDDARSVYIAVMTVVYHGVVVVFLWGATEVATRKHADRAPKVKRAMGSTGGRASGAATNPKGRRASEAPKQLTPTMVVPMTSKDTPSVNGARPSGLIIAGR